MTSLHVRMLLIFLFVSFSAHAKEWRVYDKDSFNEAFKKVASLDTIYIEKGEYPYSAVLRAQNVTIMAVPGAVMAGSAAKGKAALVIKGDGTRIYNLECHSISVRDGNGACIRLEAPSLYLDNVYFHDSQQGILASRNAELIEINKSKFERLGYGGRAHGIYFTGKGKLFIKNSVFVSSQGEGHEIKSRGSLTVIENSVVASLDGIDSRLIDIPNGGELIVRNSVLQQGTSSSNTDVIGFGLEGRKFLHKINRVTLEGNMIILDRHINRILHLKDPSYEVNARNNAIIGKSVDELPGFNLMLESREKAGIDPVPFLPSLPLDNP